MKSIALKFLLVFLFAAALGCGGDEEKAAASGGAEKPKSMLAEEADPKESKGVGPITQLTLAPAIDQAMADKGKTTYEKLCSACHKPTEKFIGPAPKGILDRRSPEWVMNMILNPVEMVQKDPVAKKLLMEFNGSPMADQNLTEEDARAVLEYFRTL